MAIIEKGARQTPGVGAKGGERPPVVAAQRIDIDCARRSALESAAHS